MWGVAEALAAAACGPGMGRGRVVDMTEAVREKMDLLEMQTDEAELMAVRGQA